MQEVRVKLLGPEDPLEKDMATHSSILPWRVPWTEEPCGLQSIGSQRVRHDWSDWAPMNLYYLLQSKQFCPLIPSMKVIKENPAMSRTGWNRLDSLEKRQSRMSFCSRHRSPTVSQSLLTADTGWSFCIYSSGTGVWGSHPLLQEAATVELAGC